ncbi:MAG TPA: delta-aminolevulinic acid dehydratase [Cyanothece sp. UBA12306]|nr:delta-aminolevulinic acid dehydratase [Cyanothece sp. UBA12306]
MTLINSEVFNNFAITVGTLLFLFIVFWAFWFAAKID